MSRRPRRTLPLLLAALAAPALAAAPADAAKAPQRCSQLKGKDLYPKNPQVKLVVRSRTYRNDVGYEGYRNTYRACTGRHGRVHLVDYAGDNGTSNSILAPGVTAGRYFLMLRTDESVDQDYVSLRVYDAKTGRSRVLYSEGDKRKNCVSERPFSVVQDGNGPSTALDGSGAAAVVFADDGGESTPEFPIAVSVAAFDAEGRCTVLDTGGTEIGRTSLALKAGLLSWTHGAETRTYGLRKKG